MAYRVFNTSYVKVSKNPKKLVFSVFFLLKRVDILKLRAYNMLL